MAEHDNAGFPLSYCLLSTASAIDNNKRTKALTGWAKCLKDSYGINPTFVHVDKDMAEIAMAKAVWSTKVSLCWWHLRRAVRARLANGKLSTTPYNVIRARDEFNFIDLDFVPQGNADAAEFEGGLPESHHPTATAPLQTTDPNVPAPTHATPLAPLSAANPANPRILISSQMNAKAREAAALAPPPRGKENRIDLTTVIQSAKGTTRKLKIKLLPPRPPSPVGPEPENEDKEDTSEQRRTFCPKAHRETIVDMMEKHYCAHPLIPGYAPPTADGIKKWAVRQMFNFCVKNELPEVWAYLWENWYRRGRWELWARSAHPLIPILKTTMILESHWRRIKHDFLHHFHMPRCDLLVWILVVKLAPLYYRKLNLLLTETGRYRELSSWRKGFKRTWKKLEKTPITMPINNAYRPNALKMVCTCPYLATSRFLLCKHLVQALEPVPPKFFLEAKRQRAAPFWEHPSLKPLHTGDVVATSTAETVNTSQIEDGGMDDEDSIPDDKGDNSEDDDHLVDMGEATHQTFEEGMKDRIHTLKDFLDGLEYQIQFRDSRMLQAIDKEGASFMRMAKACLSKERRLRTTRGGVPSTWEQSTSSAMFYRARPARGEINT